MTHKKSIIIIELRINRDKIHILISDNLIFLDEKTTMKHDYNQNKANMRKKIKKSKKLNKKRQKYRKTYAQQSNLIKCNKRVNVENKPKQGEILPVLLKNYKKTQKP